MGTNANVLNDTAQSLVELAALHNTLLAQQGGIATGTADNPNAQVPQVFVRRPWLDAPSGAVPFDPQLSVTLGAVGVTTLIVSHTVPDGYDGVINAYSWNTTAAGFIDGSGDIIVVMLRNGAPVRNYEAITVQKGSVQIPRPIAPMRVYSKDVISLSVTHAANNILAGNVIASLVGYDYPSES